MVDQYSIKDMILFNYPWSLTCGPPRMARSVPDETIYRTDREQQADFLANNPVLVR